MNDDQVKAIVHEVLIQQAADPDAIVLKTIATILTSFGIEEEDRKEFKADLVHLRKWRKSVEQAQTYGFKVIITTIVGGLLGALWLGIKVTVGK